MEVVAVGALPRGALRHDPLTHLVHQSLYLGIWVFAAELLRHLRSGLQPERNLLLRRYSGDVLLLLGDGIEHAAAVIPQDGDHSDDEGNHEPATRHRTSQGGEAQTYLAPDVFHGDSPHVGRSGGP